VAAAAARLIKSEIRNEASARREHLIGLGTTRISLRAW